MAGTAVLGGIVCATHHQTSRELRRDRLEPLDARMLPLAARHPEVTELGALTFVAPVTVAHVAFEAVRAVGGNFPSRAWSHA